MESRHTAAAHDDTAQPPRLSDRSALRGAVLALLLTLLGLATAVGSSGEQLRALAAIALVVPGLLYVGWWLVLGQPTGVPDDREEGDDMERRDAALRRSHDQLAARLERIFDEAGSEGSFTGVVSPSVPAADDAARRRLRGTVRRTDDQRLREHLRPRFRQAS